MVYSSSVTRTTRTTDEKFVLTGNKRNEVNIPWVETILPMTEPKFYLCDFPRAAGHRESTLAPFCSPENSPKCTVWGSAKRSLHRSPAFPLGYWSNFSLSVLALENPLQKHVFAPGVWGGAWGVRAGPGSPGLQKHTSLGAEERTETNPASFFTHLFVDKTGVGHLQSSLPTPLVLWFRDLLRKWVMWMRRFGRRKKLQSSLTRV